MSEFLLRAVAFTLSLVVAGCSQEPGDQQSRQETTSVSGPLQPIASETVVRNDGGPNSPSRGDIAILTRLLAAERGDRKNDNFTPGFRAASVDLNGDGTREIMLRFEGLGHCGSGGCALRVYQREGETLPKISGTTLTFLPIGILPTSTEGWRDLAITMRGDYVAGSKAVLRFSGGGYPLTTEEPASDLGIIVLSEDSPIYRVD